MPNHFRTALIVMLALIANGGTAWAQDARALTVEQKLSDPVYLAWVSYDLVGTCVDCHINGPTDDEILGGRLSKYSRRREMRLWLQEDKHAIARRRVEPITTDQIEQQVRELFTWIDGAREEAITNFAKLDRNLDLSKAKVNTSAIHQWFGSSNQLSRQICDKLYGDGQVDTDEGYARFRNECLTCHGGYSDGAIGFERVAAPDQKQLGISCLYCHQTGTNIRWIDEHRKPDTWRLKPPAAKATEGMADLTNTVNQVQLCADCHIGNRDKGMFVSHEMYAAGHPPLPPLEAQTFCQELPHHWQTPRQLFENTVDESDRTQYFQINFPGLPTAAADKVFWNTRKMLIGALASKKHYLDLLIQSADDQDWGDYSLYDCSACHHELRAASFRQSLRTSGQHGHLGAPGRPRPHDWTQPLLPIAYQIGGRATLAKIVQLEKSLEQSFGNTPFGDRVATTSIARELRNEISALLLLAQTQTIDEKVARRILQMLANSPDAAVLSYDAARQIAWASNVIADELAVQGQPLAADVSERIKSSGDSNVTGVGTSLPSGRANFIYPQSLKAELNRRARYDARVFIDHLRSIAESLE